MPVVKRKGQFVPVDDFQPAVAPRTGGEQLNGVGQTVAVFHDGVGLDIARILNYLRLSLVFDAGSGLITKAIPTRLSKFLIFFGITI